MWWRYDLGAIVHVVRYSVSFDLTPTVVEGLGRGLAMRADTLRRFARVAERMSPGEFAEHMRLRNRMGLPLTWSHIEELAELRNAKARREHARAAATEGLSVRQLATLIRTVKATKR
jgi:hypothetical protein